MTKELVQFLQQDIGLSSEQVNFTLRHLPEAPNHLPMILWQYGLVNLGQLEKVFDWIEAV